MEAARTLNGALACGRTGSHGTRDKRLHVCQGSHMTIRTITKAALTMAATLAVATLGTGCCFCPLPLDAATVANAVKATDTPEVVPAVAHAAPAVGTVQAH